MVPSQDTSVPCYSAAGGTMPGRHLSIQGVDALLLLVVTAWGLNLSLIKIALRAIPALPFNGIRLLLASAVLLAALLLSEGSVRVRRQDWLKLGLLALSGHTIYQYLFIRGVDLTTASNTAVIFGSGPILITLFSAFFKHERITPLGWTGIVLGFVGLTIVTTGRTGGLHLSARTWQGDLLLMAAVVLWAHYSVAAKPLLRVYSPLKFTTVTMGIGSVMFFPFSAGALRRLDFAAVPGQAWLCLAYSGAIALSLALVLWFISVRTVGNSQTAIFSNLQPVLAVLFARWLLDESITASLLAGGAIIFVAIILTRRGRAKQAGGEPCA